MRTLIATVALVVLAVPAARAATCTAVSPSTQNTLVELYTSEGCSSCPPADRWLSRLPTDRLVPLAFHVDYWDRLGWKDRFAQPAFTQRQRARNAGLGWVYTPQVMLDGRDHRAWHRSAAPAITSRPAPASLAMRITQSPAAIVAQVDSRFAPGVDAAGVGLYLALFENRLSSQVAAGENARRTLHHDYVVRELAGPFGAGARHRFALDADWKPADLGVAAFVLDSEGRTLQALARPGCP